jgi:hypothetical protein
VLKRPHVITERTASLNLANGFLLWIKYQEGSNVRFEFVSNRQPLAYSVEKVGRKDYEWPDFFAAISNLNWFTNKAMN